MTTVMTHPTKTKCTINDCGNVVIDFKDDTDSEVVHTFLNKDTAKKLIKQLQELIK
jgi:hypothetical protein